MKPELHLFQVGATLISPDILTEYFSCDYAACRGACCVEGDAGAPVTPAETLAIEDALDAVWPRLTAAAQRVIDRQGVAYADRDGDLVTSIVRGRDCVFACHGAGGCRCALEELAAARGGGFRKPASCALYPIREKRLAPDLTGLNYHRWHICAPAREKGRREGTRVYQFLRGPLTERFGEEWYAELCQLAEELGRQGML